MPHKEQLRDQREAERFRAFGAMVVHDLNNALFAVTGRAQLLERRASDDATRQSTRELLDSIGTLSEMLRTLREACRAEALASEPRPLRDLLAEALAPLGPFGEPVARLLDSIPAALDCDLTPDAVRVGLAQCLEAHARFGASAPEASIAVEESDYPRAVLTIASVARPDSPAAFSPPSLLDGSISQTGLGLLAAQRAIREAGGRVSWRIEPAAGGPRLNTELSFEVIAPEPPSAGAIPPAGATPTAPGGSEPRTRRVLIADDDHSVRAILVAVLESAGDEVDTMEVPGDIAIRGDLDQFDVAILDAGGGGLEALDRLRSNGCRLPVLLASGDLVERPDDPLTRFAMKPLRIEALDAVLDELIESGQAR